MEKFLSSPSPQTLSDEKLQAFAEAHLVRPKALQELPLILIPPQLQHLSEQSWRHSSIVQADIKAWTREARLEDERLRIERRLIPYTPIYIPDTDQGKQFFKIAKAIADIPLQAGVVPKSQDQGYWLKTLHYFWQALGVVIAHKCVGVIPDPLAENGILERCLSEKNLENLRLAAAIDLTCLELLEHSCHYIREWATQKQILFPFDTPFDLFIEILEEDFFDSWQLDCSTAEINWSTKLERTKYVAAKIRCLRYWDEDSQEEDSAYYQRYRNEYYQYLFQTGWNGYWLLALRKSAYSRELYPYWKVYIKALIKGKKLFITELDWRQGGAHRKRNTNSVQQVKGTIDLLGFIRWCWA